MRNSFLRQISALGLFLSVLAMPVKADTGFAIGVMGNVSDFKTTGTETEMGGINKDPNETTSASITESVTFASGFAELVHKEGHMGVTIGVELIPGAAELGTSTRTDTDSAGSTAGSGTDDDGTYTAKAEIDDHITFYVEPTVYASDSIGLYLKGGASRITVVSLESIAIGDDSSAYGNEDVWGAMYGVGLRLKHSSGLLVKVEYSKTEYGEVSLTSTTGNKNVITARPEQESTRLAIGYQF